MTTHTQIQTQKQSLRFSPQQIQALNLLQLSVMELDQKIKDEIEANPALDIEIAPTPQSEINGGDEIPAPPSKERDMDYSPNETMSDDFSYQDYTGASYSEELHYEKPVVQQVSFRQHLKQQLELQPLSERQKALAEYLIDLVEDDGYLRHNLSDLADDISFGLNIFVKEEEVFKTLQMIQRLEPIGVGARDLQEYLMLQLREAASQARNNLSEPALSERQAIISWACAIVGDYLDDLASRNYEKIRRLSGVSEADLKKAVRLISALNPKPTNGMSRFEDVAQRIKPDFIVSDDNGRLEISVLGVGFNYLKLNKGLLETLEALDKTPNPRKDQKQTAQYIRNKIGSAQWFMDAIKQREHSLTHTIHTIVNLQKEYFLTGDVRKLKPMILKDVADRVGLDVSTISRVTSSRYVQTDFGVLSLKKLFTEGLMTETGQLVSNLEIQSCLMDLIESEDKTNPLTDGQIVHELAKNGYTIARRTAAKYREGLGVPAAQTRRGVQ